MAKSDILFLGDSLTDNGEWAEMLADANVKNRGIKGDTTKGVLNRLDILMKGQPAAIFVSIGANDLEGGSPISEVIANYQLIIQKLKKGSPTTQIYIQSLLPVNEEIYDGKLKNEQIIRFNKELQILANNNNLSYIDLFSIYNLSTNGLSAEDTYDGIHLNGKGYQKWTKQLETIINTL